MATKAFARLLPASCRHRLLRIDQNGALIYSRTLASVNQKQNDDRIRFSTSSSGSGRDQTTRIQRFRMLMNTFVFGSKQLATDVKRMVQIRRKLRDSSYDWDKLSTEEILVLHQVCLNLAQWVSSKGGKGYEDGENRVHTGH